jgi:hypothetical protein
MRRIAPHRNATQIDMYIKSACTSNSITSRNDRGNMACHGHQAQLKRQQRRKWHDWHRDAEWVACHVRTIGRNVCVLHSQNGLRKLSKGEYSPDLYLYTFRLARPVAGITVRNCLVQCRTQSKSVSQVCQGASQTSPHQHPFAAAYSQNRRKSH